ncbi:MAG: class A beta-lactamase [Vulcanimicrobiaceae bacterium]
MNRLGFLAAGIGSLLAAAPMPPFRELEERFGGRLGVFAVDLGTGKQVEHRANERFPMCSTFKLLAVAAILKRVRNGEDRLSRSIPYTSENILKYAPVTQRHLDAAGNGSMTLGELCAAAIEWSDNTAANLLLEELGGPVGVTDFAFSMGDSRTRLDRTEPELNTALPGDPRDTTTPASMANDLRELVFGNVLGRQSRMLRAWMLNCQTAAGGIPAGLPRGWTSGNKTGSGGYATANDVAFLIPPQGAPKIVAAYYTRSRATPSQQDAILADVARIVTRYFTSRDVTAAQFMFAKNDSMYLPRSLGL